jgi:hypothetical protein
MPCSAIGARRLNSLSENAATPKANHVDAYRDLSNSSPLNLPGIGKSHPRVLETLTSRILQASSPQSPGKHRREMGLDVPLAEHAVYFVLLECLEFFIFAA